MSLTYQVVYADTPGELELLVRVALGQGWQVMGGVAVSWDEPPVPKGEPPLRGLLFCQAMMKERPASEEGVL